VVADIPGLIEGAHHGAGLGLRFLRHVERTDLLLHILDISWMPDRDPVREYEAINLELALFSKELAEKRQIIVINKIDLPAVKENLPKIIPWFVVRNLKVFPISAATGEGITPLLDEIARTLWGRQETE
jgi:GTP-binding protein